MNVIWLRYINKYSSLSVVIISWFRDDSPFFFIDINIVIKHVQFSVINCAENAIAEDERVSHVRRQLNVGYRNYVCVFSWQMRYQWSGTMRFRCQWNATPVKVRSAFRATQNPASICEDSAHVCDRDLSLPENCSYCLRKCNDLTKLPLNFICKMHNNMNLFSVEWWYF